MQETLGPDHDETKRVLPVFPYDESRVTDTDFGEEAGEPFEPQDEYDDEMIEKAIALFEAATGITFDEFMEIYAESEHDADPRDVLSDILDAGGYQQDGLKVAIKAGAYAIGASYGIAIYFD